MKKLITVLLALAMVASLSVTAFAADTTITDSGTGSAEIGFCVDPTYTITIPATVTLEKVTDNNGVVTYENDYTITAAAGMRLLNGRYIEVTVNSDFVMETDQYAELNYEIYDGNNKAIADNGVVATFKTSKTEQSSTIHIKANDPEYAGDYKDTVIFTVAVTADQPI